MTKWKHVVFSKFIALQPVNAVLVGCLLIYYSSLMNMIFNPSCFSLDNNNIRGTLPTEFGGLESAETLWLSKLNMSTVL